MAHKPLQRATIQRRGHADAAAQGTTRRLSMPPPYAREGPGDAADAVSAEPRIPNADRLFWDTDDRDQPAERPTSCINAVVTTSFLQEREPDPNDLTGLAQQDNHRVWTARIGRQHHSGSPRAGLDDSGAHKAQPLWMTQGQQVPLDDQLQTEGALTQACFGCRTTLLAQTSYEFPHCPAGNAFCDIVHTIGHFERSHTGKKQSTGVMRHLPDSISDVPHRFLLSGTDGRFAVVGLDINASSVSASVHHDAYRSPICRTTSVENAARPCSTGPQSQAPRTTPTPVSHGHDGPPPVSSARTTRKPNPTRDIMWAFWSPHRQGLSLHQRGRTGLQQHRPSLRMRNAVPCLRTSTESPPPRAQDDELNPCLRTVKGQSLHALDDGRRPRPTDGRCAPARDVLRATAQDDSPRRRTHDVANASPTAGRRPAQDPQRLRAT